MASQSNKNAWQNVTEEAKRLLRDLVISQSLYSDLNKSQFAHFLIQKTPLIQLTGFHCNNNSKKWQKQKSNRGKPEQSSLETFISAPSDVHIK